MTDALTTHLRAWVGAWPPTGGIEVTGPPSRDRPGWDGAVRPFVGVDAGAAGTVLAVPAAHREAVAATVSDLGWHERARRVVADRLGGGTIAAGVFRSAHDVPGDDRLPDAGTWVEAADPRVPPWLRPFNGGVLLALDDHGAYAAGVGVKRHDEVGHELSVGTDDAHRGRGLGRRLVAQAARRLLAEGAAVTYLHAPDNHASARVADAAGFPDHGWRVWGLFRPDVDP